MRKVSRTLSTGLSALALAVSLTLPCSALARDLVIALSPHQSVQIAAQNAKATLGFLLDLEPGDTATLMDGYHVTTLGVFKVPEDQRYQSPKARLAKNRTAAQKLLRFARQASPGKHDLPLSNAVNLPGLLSAIAENRQGDEPVDVLIQGSPFYADPRDPAFAMIGGRFPSDGHLAHGRETTPFGIDGPDAFTGLRVHMAYDETSPMENSRHKEALTRWWTLNIERQGGQLVSFSHDLPTVLTRIQNKVRPPRHDYRVLPGDKLEMIRLRPVRIKHSIHDRELSTVPLPEAAVSRAQDVEIGLSWHNCDDCDLDLYVKPHTGAKALYFNRDKTPLGVFFKDYRKSPHGAGAYETVALNVPVDLGELQVAVNFYSGHAPGGVSGEVRIAVDGATYGRRFHLQAKDGNSGAGVVQVLKDKRSSQPQTQLIDPLQIVALR